MKRFPEKKKNRSIMVITGGILALICPTEYYKRHAEILKNKTVQKPFLMKVGRCFMFGGAVFFLGGGATTFE